MNFNPITNSPTSPQVYTDTANKLLQIPQQLPLPPLSGPCVGMPQQMDSSAGGLIGGIVQLFSKMLDLISSFFGGSAGSNSTNMGIPATNNFAPQMPSAPRTESGSSFTDTLLSVGKEIFSGLFGGNGKSSGSGDASSTGSIISSIGSFIRGLF